MPIFKTKRGRWKVVNVRYPVNGFKTKKEAVKQLAAVKISQGGYKMFSKKLKLVRVSYGKKGTPPEMREYRIEGRGPVGTIKEYKEHFPGKEFEIEDKIEK